MSSDEKFSIDDILSMFHNESKKLENLINNATTKSELPIPEIIETYYQITNVSSMITMLKQQLGGSDKHNSLIKKIEETQKFISEKFDSNLHPSIVIQLENLLTDITKNLQTKSTLEKSKDEIESEAKLYETLRQTMSTKEFVEQYDKGLSHD